jgi:hypothetical protein
VKLASITFLSLAFSYWIDYLGFINEGKLAAVLITPSLGVPNWSVIYIINTSPSNPPPQALTSLVPKRKLNSVNMTTGLWSEVSINKIWTRSITLTKAQVIIDSNLHYKKTGP